jgi:phenol 2-monooxygenase
MAVDIAYSSDYAADIRKRFIIKSMHGTLMMIPRERKLVRIYVELPFEAAERYRAEHNAGILMEQVATIMKPYSIRTNYVDWSTMYTVSTPPFLC